MGDTVVAVVARLRARREEIERDIFSRVRSVVPDPVGDRDAEYAAGLHAAVVAGMEFVFMGLERRDEGPMPIPAETVAQAHRAARSGVRVEAVLRRYMVGHAVMWDYLMEEAENARQVAGEVELTSVGGGLRQLLSAQAALLDQLVIGVAEEHAGELERAGRSRELHLAERVRMLLAGERVDGVALDYEIDDAEHLGMIVRGTGIRTLLRELARDLDRRLLCVARGEGTVWAWLGGRRGLEMSEVLRALEARGLSARSLSAEGAATREVVEAESSREERDQARDRSSLRTSLAIGEPAWGLEGWRLTHRQAQAALVVALRSPRALTRYAEVALLASALSDEILARTLIDTYLVPLDDTRGGGPVLRETLRAYIAAEHHISSAAAALGVARNTVKNRLLTIEDRLGLPLHPCPAELEVALELDKLGR